MLDELWEKATALLALLASSGLLAWLLGGRRRNSVETRQIEISTEDAHDRAISELRKMDAETHRIKVTTLIDVIAASKQLAQDYKTIVEELELELKAERQSRAEERAAWTVEQAALRQELADTKRQLGELTAQVDTQAAITEAQTAIIGQQQEEIADLKRENAALHTQLDEERQKRRELEKRIEGRNLE